MLVSSDMGSVWDPHSPVAAGAWLEGSHGRSFKFDVLKAAVRSCSHGHTHARQPCASSLEVLSGCAAAAHLHQRPMARVLIASCPAQQQTGHLPAGLLAHRRGGHSGGCTRRQRDRRRPAVAVAAAGGAPSRTAGVSPSDRMQHCKVGQACNVPHCPRLATPSMAGNACRTRDSMRCQRRQRSAPGPAAGRCRKRRPQTPTGTYAFGSGCAPCSQARPHPRHPCRSLAEPESTPSMPPAA